MDLSLSLSPLGRQLNVLPGRLSLALLIKSVGGVLQDTVGLSVSDYLLVDVTIRDIFFIDASTLRPIEDAYALARVSPFLNMGTMIGRGEKSIAVYVTGTDMVILLGACSYYKVTYGDQFYDFDVIGKSVFGTPDIGAYEYP